MMNGESPSDGLPTRRPPGARADVRSSLRSKRWSYTRKCLAAIFGSTLLALVVVDHGVLAWIEAAAAADAQSSIQLATRNWQQEDARINENNLAKIRTEPDDWIWRTDAFPTAETPRKPHRILVVGDSFVWGDGYANMNDIWWRQLERELRRRGYHDVEVIGLGACGASTRQQLDHLRSALPRYRPDLVIWGYVTNDPDEGRIKQFDYRRLDKDAVVRLHDAQSERGLLRRLNFQLEQRRREKLLQTLPGPKRGYEYQEWEHKLLEPENLAAYEKTVHEVAAFMREAGTPYFFLTLPNYPGQKSFRARYAPVEPIFANAGIEFVDMLDEFAAAYPNANPLSNDLAWGINPANAHPGVISTRFYARKAADRLERSHPQVLGPRGEPAATAAPEINDWMPAGLVVRENTAGQIRFEYPNGDAKMLRMPIERDHVALHLAMPSNLGAIRLAGPDLASAQIHLTHVDADDGIDSGAVQSEPEQRGAQLEWALPAASGQLVNTIRVVAEFTGADRSLTLQLLERTP